MGDIKYVNIEAAAPELFMIVVVVSLWIELAKSMLVSQCLCVFEGIERAVLSLPSNPQLGVSSHCFPPRLSECMYSAHRSAEMQLSVAPYICFVFDVMTISVSTAVAASQLFMIGDVVSLQI